jgi:ribosome biogenesis GTPase
MRTGLREVGISTASARIAGTFPGIPELTEGSRVPDLRHRPERGSAVQEAVRSGILPQKSLENYLRLTKELASKQEKSEIGLVRFERKRWKALMVQARDIRNVKSGSENKPRGIP